MILHAVCDALLGAAALGDIGTHFPDSDERYRGISSMKLLGEVVRLLRREKWRVGNVDVMLQLEAPKVMAHVPAMRKGMANVLNVPETSVSVKATTMEGLGPIGHREGCAAFAVAVLLPAGR